MSINVDLIGETWDAGTHRWTSTDALLYALGIGAGTDELAFTTENTRGVAQQVLPTFPVVVLGEKLYPSLGDFALSQVLHAEQSVTLQAPLPVDATVRVKGCIPAMYDKGKHAHIVIERSLYDEADDRLLASTTATIFVRGEGGFGGDRGPSTAWDVPDGVPDHVLAYPIPAEQALIYRLTGDRNPLHSDPTVAADVGFPRPILHGLCTFGYAGRALLAAVCGGDVGRFRAISARFTAPVLPGQELKVQVWNTPTGALFRAMVGDDVVLDRGVLTINITDERS